MGENGEGNTDYNNYDYNRSVGRPDPHASLAGIALVMGLVSIPMCLFLNLGVVVGGIAIILAILSKGTMEKMLPPAKKAILYGTLGIVIGYGVFIFDLHTVLTDPSSREQLNTMSEQINGVSFDDMLKEIGITLDE